MDTEEKYRAIRHPGSASLDIKQCYLCGKPLTGVVTSDHIIPHSMFPASGGEDQPQLPVHATCNGSKSTLDRRFKMRILLMSSLNPVASKILMDDLFRPSQEQSKNAYLIGYNHKIPEYKLKKTLARDFSHHFDIPYNGQHLVEVEGSKKHVSELNRYASQMARGLFIRNVDGAQPGKVKINWVDRSMLSIKGVDLKKVMNPLQDMITNAESGNLLFGQIWPGHLGYLGAPASDVENAGFVWIDFYDTFGALAIIRPPTKL